MRPDVQLCLMSDDLPAPPPLLLEVLPEEAVTVALGRLARLIARAIRPAAVNADLEGDDGD